MHSKGKPIDVTTTEVLGNIHAMTWALQTVPMGQQSLGQSTPSRYQKTPVNRGACRNVLALRKRLTKALRHRNHKRDQPDRLVTQWNPAVLGAALYHRVTDT